MSDTGVVFLHDDHLVMDFPYNPQQVAEVKQILGAKWDKLAKVWRAPMTSLPEVRQFANKHRFTIDPEVALFDLPNVNIPSTGLFRDGDWVIVSFPYDAVKVRMVKQIPGVTWHAGSKAWRAPMSSVTHAIEWADKFDLPVDDELRNEADESNQRRSELIAASRLTDAEIVIHGFIGEPFPYQRAGIAYASESRRCFIADDMGLGKTLQAIGTLEYAHSEFAPSYPAVVVCPPKLVLNWAKEYEKWLPGRVVATVTDRKAFPDDGYDVVVVGWSNLTHWVEHLKKHRSYVFDESHSAKNPTTQRTKAAVKLTKTAPADGIVLCLTGTPITNRPAEYAPQLQILGKLDKFGGLYGYYRTYCAAFKDRWGHWHIDGASNLDSLNDRLRGEGLYVRRTKDQVLTELPPVLHDVLTVEGDGAAMREYRKAEEDIVAYLVERAKQLAAEMGVSPKSAAVRAKMAAESNEHLVRFSVLRRLAAKAKMENVAEFINEHVEAGQKVVVAAHHREITGELSNRYGGLHIIGGQRPDDVERVKSVFQSDPESKVIVLSIQAAKEGHTLTASQNVLFVELPWTWADVEQTYSRCHRIGQKGSVTSTYMLCAGTVDEEIYSLIQKKREVVKAAVEGGEVESFDVGKELVGKFLQLGLDNAVNI